MYLYGKSWTLGLNKNIFKNCQLNLWEVMGNRLRSNMDQQFLPLWSIMPYHLCQMYLWHMFKLVGLCHAEHNRGLSLVCFLCYVVKKKHWLPHEEWELIEFSDSLLQWSTMLFLTLAFVLFSLHFDVWVCVCACVCLSCVPFFRPEWRMRS